MECADCGKTVTLDETGLSKKLINRATTRFYCLDCLSIRLKIPPETLLELAQRFKAAGCTCFQ